MCFGPIVTKFSNHADRASWRTCGARITAMQNQQVMGILKVAFRRKFEQLLLHMQHRFARAQPSSVGNSKNMRVHCDSRFSKRGIQDNICGFAADTRESF